MAEWTSASSVQHVLCFCVGIAQTGTALQEPGDNRHRCVLTEWALAG
jgi:hypothetical protein